MRRFACVLAAVLLLAPAGLRLAASGAGSEALRCAIVCGHAAAPGAACCALSGFSGKDATMAACPAGDTQGATSPLPAPPAILAAIHRLPAPLGGSPLATIAAAVPSGPSGDLPEHVPLLLLS